MTTLKQSNNYSSDKKCSRAVASTIAENIAILKGETYASGTPNNFVQLQMSDQNETKGRGILSAQSFWGSGQHSALNAFAPMRSDAFGNTIENNKRSGRSPFIQPKLTINAPGDQYEQEADAMADKVMRMPANNLPFSPPSSTITPIQRRCKNCEDDEKLHRKENSAQPIEAGHDVSSYVSSLSSKGSPMPEGAKSFFEPRFGRDFSNVKVHTDGVAAKSAQSINALAYTTGNNIVFNQNQFSPETDSGKRLLAHELTHVVQQKGMIRRKPKSKPTVPPIQYYLDNDGNIFSGTSADALSLTGYKSSTKSYLFIEPTGTLSLTGTGEAAASVKWPIYKAKEIKSIKDIKQTPDTQPGALKPVEIVLLPNIVGIVYDSTTKKFGGNVMGYGGAGFGPVDVKKLPADLQKDAGIGSKVELNDGKFWILMSFRLNDEHNDKVRWVPAGHDKKDYQQHQKTIDDQAEKLPSNLKDAMADNLKIIGLVSTVEGSFGSTSPSGDTSASLGIFQWAMGKTSKDSSSSLAAFFKDLKNRAVDAKKTPAKSQTDEQKLYIKAWKACTDKGIDIDKKGRITRNGEAANGADVESSMSSTFKTSEDLRTYQLVASQDWIEEFKKTIVRPGVVGVGIVGNGYAERSATQTTFNYGKKYSVDLQAPENTSTVGDYFTSEKGLAMAVMLGVNRPHYVETSLWRAVCGEGDPKSKITDLIKKLIALFESAPPASGKKLKHATLNDDVAKALGADALSLYTSLQNLIWPVKGDYDEDKLINDFQKQALLLYKPSDARRFKRERRFTTVEGADW